MVIDQLIYMGGFFMPEKVGESAKGPSSYPIRDDVLVYRHLGCPMTQSYVGIFVSMKNAIVDAETKACAHCINETL
ncbi:hypothetical protein QNH28_15460 [Paenibacillus sp. G2S3]|uniref:hypothetical protein n=1 Tax=Paenibacillus sp. G2S3 TaxID=3047872 RepID=UPI0024C2016B|nr:hypothetical protein [Paenibacillus sp. G2S3]WHY16930.1 hypothetical protein QNH28_15460 [Paenibacillus sp. G2S3]